MEEWKEYKLEDTSIEMIDGDRGKNYPKNNDFLSDGYCLFLNAGNVTKDGFSFSDKSFITQEKDDELRKGRLEKYDVVITTRGTVGNVALYDNKVPFEHIRINSGMLILKSGKDILSEYLYYYLKGKKFQSQISLFVSGSAQPQLPKSTLGKMSISYPNNKDTQNKIVSILKSLDDKIEVNRKTNENLEQQAQALFKSWFVDFEPFKNGEFVESELGMIPKGWRVERIEDLSQKMASGGTPKSLNKDYYLGNIKWYSTKELKDCFLFDSEKHISEDALKKSSAKMFPEGTVLMAIYASPTVGRLGILTNPATFNQAAVGIVPKENVGSEFIYLSLLSERTNLNNLASGAAQQNLNVGIVKNYNILVPEQKVLDRFNRLARSYFLLLKKNTEESRRLAELRDTLLPKLMSGELKVNDIH